MSKTIHDHIEPKDLEEWRSWLEANHSKPESIWLVLAKKGSNMSTMDISDVIDTALCYGWIDSLPNKIDAERYKVRFSPRNPKSNWSKVNKDKVEQLMAAGRMAQSGLDMIALAKRTGTWMALNDVDNLIIPDDLKVALNSLPDALDNFNNFPPSTRRGILEWIFNAKRSSTRADRISTTASLADQNVRANQYERK